MAANSIYGVPYYSPLNINGQAMNFAVLQNSSTAPTAITAVTGQVYFNTTSNMAQLCTLGGGSPTWVPLAPFTGTIASLGGLAASGIMVNSSGALGAVSLAVGAHGNLTVANANGTGGNPVFDTCQNITTADSPTFNAVVIGETQSGLPPTSNHAATINYVNTVLNGLSWKEPAVMVFPGAINGNATLYSVAAYAFNTGAQQLTMGSTHALTYFAACADAGIFTIPMASMISGQSYIIQVVGTTVNWTAMGASTGAVDVVFTYNGTTPTGAGGFVCLNLVGARVLIIGETGSQAPYNGVYTVTTFGVEGTTPCVLTRTSDFNLWSDIVNAAVPVETGSNYGGNTFLCTNGTIGTLNTTGITFSELPGATATLAGPGLYRSGNQLAIGTSGASPYLPLANGGTGASITGISGGLLYFSSGSAMACSGAYGSNSILFGQGAGNAPGAMAAGTTGQVLVGNTSANPGWTAAAGTAGQALIYNGTSSIPSWGALALGTGINVSGQLPVANGGTGLATLTQGGIMYATGSGTMNCTAGGTASGQVVIWNGTAPIYGTLGVGGGGTGLTVGVSGGIPYYSSTTSMASSTLLAQYGVMLGGGAGAAPSAISSLGTANQVLTSNGAGNAPTWQGINANNIMTGIMSSTVGGTGSQYVAFTGPSTGCTYTLPTASAVLAQKKTGTTAAITGGAQLSIPHALASATMHVFFYITSTMEAVDIDYTCDSTNIYITLGSSYASGYFTWVAIG